MTLVLAPGERMTAEIQDRRSVIRSDGEVVPSARVGDTSHPKWCPLRWCTAGTAHSPQMHRSDYREWFGADGIVYRMYLEAEEDGSDVGIRLLAQSGSHPPLWWDPTDAVQDIAVSLSTATLHHEALLSLLVAAGS